MVSMNLHKMLEKTKREITRRLEEVSVESHPVDFAWLLYALQYEKDTPFFSENLRKLKRWSISDASGKNDKDLGALALCVYFINKSHRTDRITVSGKVNEISERNLKKSFFKYSVLNNPGEMFLLSLISNQLEEEFKIKLSRSIMKNLSGTISRKILFLATLINLGVNEKGIKDVIYEIFSIELERIEDMIAVIWFLKKYKEHKIIDIIDKMSKIWHKINAMYLSIEDENGRLLLSTQNLALIYEAINIELKFPEPFFIFSLYPFEEEIRKVCEEYFKHGKYPSAVFQAVLKLIEFLKSKTGIDEPSETKLIRDIMKFKTKEKKPSEVKLQFNEYLEYVSGKNEQEGLALIFEGIIKAFRHPKGHNPEDHELVKINPYEALAQLIFIDYLLKRVKNAKTQGKLP